MKNNIREYARVGLVHHLLYPQCMMDPDDHVKTLCHLMTHTDIETLDCCIPYGEKRRKIAVDAVKSYGKEVVYALHLFPLEKISLTSLCPQEQAQARLIVDDQIRMAASIDATGFVFASGNDVPKIQRQEARKAFARFCRWFCTKLKQHEIIALLEPFDRDVDKKFLYGPTAECVELIKSLEPEIDNLGIVLDVAHLPLMGEPFAYAFKSVATYLKRIHLGNCVLKDRSHPWYGDKHPPIGFEGGEINIPELAEILRLALDIGYLSKKKRGALIFEMQPFPNKTAEQTIAESMARLRMAWSQI